MHKCVCPVCVSFKLFICFLVEILTRNKYRRTSLIVFYSTAVSVDFVVCVLWYVIGLYFYAAYKYSLINDLLEITLYC